MATFAPGHRLAYDRDGSAVYRWAGGTPSHPAQADWKNINDESNANIAGMSNGVHISIVFPVPVDIVGLYMAGQASFGGFRYVDWSTNTTDGLDGNWTNVIDQSIGSRDVPSTYRTLIDTVNLPGVIGLRMRHDGTQPLLRAVHVYVADQVTYLRLWHPTLDEEIDIEDLDFGTVAAGATIPPRTFRIKNVNPEPLTAQSVSVTTLAHTAPAWDSHVTFSLDDSTYERPLDIGNIAQNAISPLIYMKYEPPIDATVRMNASQLSAIPSSWAA